MITATPRRPAGPATSAAQPTITETLNFREAPSLFVGGYLKDGSFRAVPVEQALTEERLKQLLSNTTTRARVPVPESAALKDRRRTGIIIVGVDESTQHPELEDGDEFPTAAIFASVMGVTAQQISNYLTTSRRGTVDDNPSWGRAKLHGITFMSIPDWEAYTLANASI